MESMVFYKSFFEAIDMLPQKEQLKAYKAIISYGITEKEPDVTGQAKIVFLMAKPQIEANIEKHNINKENGKYGKLGGRPKKADGLKNKNPMGFEKGNPKKTLNVNENVNVNVNENVNDNTTTTEGKPDGFPKAVVEAYMGILKNEVSLTEERRLILRELSKKYNLEDFMRAFKKVKDSEYLQGNNDKGWRATFDWIITEKNLVKILEGNYDRREKYIPDDDFGRVAKSFMES